MRVLLPAILLVFIGVSSLSPSMAKPRAHHPWSGSGGWGTRARYHRMYNPATVESITGEISAVEFFTPFQGMSGGLHLIVRTQDGEVPVHLGPNWFLENQDIELATGDKVEIRGSKVMFEGNPTFIAAEVQKGNSTLILRDDRGFPVWSGWRHQTDRN